MARDVNLYFHGTSASGATFLTNTTTNGPTVDLGSNTVNRALLLERRIASWSSGVLDITFQDSTDNTTFTNIPGSTGAVMGFARATTAAYNATSDSTASAAPARILLRTDKRYVRAVFLTGTTASFGAVSVVGMPLEGPYSGAATNVDA